MQLSHVTNSTLLYTLVGRACPHLQNWEILTENTSSSSRLSGQLYTTNFITSISNDRPQYDIRNLHGRHQAHETSNRLHETVRLTIYLDYMLKAASNSSSTLQSPADGEHAQINPHPIASNSDLKIFWFALSMALPREKAQRIQQDALRLMIRDSQELTQFLGKVSTGPKSSPTLQGIASSASTTRIYPSLPERPMQIGSTLQKYSAAEATCHINYQQLFWHSIFGHKSPPQDVQHWNLLHQPQRGTTIVHLDPGD